MQITKKLTANIRYSYNSEEKSILSIDQAYTQVQIGARHKINWKSQTGFIGLRLSDAFNQLSFKNTSFGDGFANSFYRKPNSRVLYFTTSFTIDNGKKIKKIDKKNRDYKKGTIG